jgi:Domain of unknown function (DUF4349)/Putative zinc-finger
MKTTTHPVAPEEVMALLDGELSPARAQLVSAHVRSCADCQNVKESFDATSRKLTSWTIGRPKDLDESALVRTACGTSSNKGTRGFVLLGQTLARKRVWAPALSAGVVFIVFLAMLPRTRVMRDAPPLGDAATLERVPRDVSPYADAAKAAGGGGSSSDDQFRATRGTEGKLHVDEALPLATDQRETTEEPTEHRVQNGPLIARTVSLSVEVKDFDAGRASLDAVLARHNGYAASLNVSSPLGAARTLEASLRIPAGELEAALHELKSLGRVEGESQNGEEVTAQHSDLIARIKNDRETEVRLQDILRTRTGKVKDVLDVEQEIARVRGEIEQMEAEQKKLEHRVDFASIDLKLAEQYKAQLTTPAPSVVIQLRNAAINGFRDAFASLLALVLFLAESGPSVLLWLALLGIPAWRLWRRYRRAQSLGALAGA